LLSLLFEPEDQEEAALFILATVRIANANERKVMSILGKLINVGF
jgi:hypothetical protein